MNPRIAGTGTFSEFDLMAPESVAERNATGDFGTGGGTPPELAGGDARATFGGAITGGVVGAIFKRGRFLALLLLVTAAFCARGESQPAREVEANVMVELTFNAQKAYADPFNEVTLDVVFTDPAGKELRVPAFWDGTTVWKARYSSPVVGRHTFRTDCANKQDQGLNGFTGVVEVKPYTGTNALFVHGQLRVSASRRFLEHADGTPFFWLGDTWWMGLSHRMHWPEDIQKLASDRKAKGYTVIQLVAGLYPDMFPFDPRGANEAGFPWETNYSGIRPQYFDAADARIFYLVDQGFTPCIVGAWGYFLPMMGVEKMKAHWRNLIARYGALPVVWCAAGEANLPWYLAKGWPYDDREVVHDWTTVMRYIRTSDPFHRLLTVHPTGLPRRSARHATDDSALLDFDMLQTPHGERAAVATTVHTERESYADQPVMPVIDGEASYEMLFNKTAAEWPRKMFWYCMMNGAAGHTYGANGIWQVNRRGDPHGKSPHGGTYGDIPWDDAMKLAGSGQIGMGKRFLEHYAWQKFEPHLEWAKFTREDPPSLKGCAWIWFPEGNPAKDAPVGKRFFRKTFTIPEGRTIKRAELAAMADDKFEARLNGAKAGTGEDWAEPKLFNDLAAMLKPGTNVLAFVAENMPAPGPNPAALMAFLKIEFTEGAPMEVRTDASWRSALTNAPGWEGATVDQAAWLPAQVVGQYGDAPWTPVGNSPLNDEAYGPQSAGIPGVVRVIYVPTGDQIVVRELGAHASYRAGYFDPVTGESTALGVIQADDGGFWMCSPPPGVNHDWVVYLEERR